MSRILVVTALREESRAVLTTLRGPRRIRYLSHPSWEGEAGTNQVMLVQGGIGRQAAGRVVTECGSGCDALVSVGFAGALARHLKPGDLVVPATIVWEDEESVRSYEVPAGVLKTVLDALPDAVRQRMTVGQLLSSPIVLATATAKREAAQRHAAVAVEMETAALATYARDQGLALVALRAILDPCDLSLDWLPPGAENTWKARARLALRPSVWSLLRTLRCHAVAASATLAQTAAAVLPALSADHPLADPSCPESEHRL